MTQAMPKHMLNSRWQLLASVVFLSGFAAAASPQTESNQKASVPWLVAYSESGGRDGRLLRVTLAADGQVLTGGGRMEPWHKTLRASAEQLLEVQTLIEGLNLTGPPKPPPAKHDPPIPDMLYVTLEVTRGGVNYPISSAPPRLVSVLRELGTEGSKRSEDEKWQKIGPFRLGRVWHVREEVRDRNGRWNGEEWVGTWTRRGEANLFDAFWQNNKTHQELRDTVVVEYAERGWVRLYRATTKWKYGAWYDPKHQAELIGSVNSCPGCSWRGQIEY